MSGGVDSERERLVASACSALGVLGRASWVNTGWLDDWVGVVGGVESPEAADEVMENEKKNNNKRSRQQTTMALLFHSIPNHTSR